MNTDMAPFISVIIPVKGKGATLEDCLASIAQNSYPRYEVIVVDDGIHHELAAKLDGAKCKIVKNLGAGVSAARNTGACEAKGEVLFFVDSDILLKPSTLGRIGATMSDPGVDGVVGLLSSDIPHKDFFSQFKNLWMHYTYSIVPRDIELFYTSVAAIRRKLFMESGGFDENYCRPSVEDTDFGHKLGKHQATIKSDKEMEVVHLKRYNLVDTLRTDFYRSSALVKHILRNSTGLGLARLRRTSVPLHFILSAGFSMVLFGGLVAALVFKPAFLPGLFLGGWFVLCLLNARFLHFLYRAKGSTFLVQSCVFLPLDIVFVDLGISHGLCSFWKGDRY